MIETGRWICVGMCLLGAVYIAGTGRDGWGWMLFVAVLLAP